MGASVTSHATEICLSYLNCAARVIRRNSVIRDFYNRLRAKQKTVQSRSGRWHAKLLTILNALIKHKTLWSESILQTAYFEDGCYRFSGY